MNPQKIGRILLLGILFGSCHKEGSEDPFLLLTQGAPTLYEIQPSFGTPRQSGERPYPPTVVRVTGKNLVDPNLSFYFNSIPAPILLRLPEEIQAEVPDGATSGFFIAVRGNSLCPDGITTGFPCKKLPFFVDCYSPYKEEFGKEIPILAGESKKIEYRGIETKAFRADRSQNPFAGSKLQISCPGPVTVRFFSPSCEVQDLILVRDPEFPLGEARIAQFLLTAGESDCTISLR